MVGSNSKETFQEDKIFDLFRKIRNIIKELVVTVTAGGELTSFPPPGLLTVSQSHSLNSQSFVLLNTNLHLVFLVFAREGFI